MAFNQGTLSKDPRFNALLPKRVPVAKPRRPINVDTSDFVETRQPAVQGGIPNDYRFTDEVDRSAVQRLIGNPVIGSEADTKRIPVTPRTTMTPTALARQAGTVGMREGQLPSWGQVKQQAYAPVDFTTDILNSIDDTRDGDEPVADKITPNKKKVTVADPNGNAQEVNTPINNFRNAIADFIREEPPANPHEYWRSMFTDGNHIPDALLRQNALDEAKMYGMGGNEDMANARMANQIRQQISELNRAYSARKLSSPGDLKGNRDEYLRQFEPLNARLTELTGVGATMLQTSNDPQLNQRAVQYLEPLNKLINLNNDFITADTSTRNLLAQQIMRDISGDKGTLSDFDVARFNLASLTPEDRTAYVNALTQFMNAFGAAAKGSGDQVLRANLNNVIQTINDAKNTDAYMAGGKSVMQMWNNLQNAGVNYGAYTQALQSQLNAFDRLLNGMGSRDIIGITNLLDNQIKNKADDFETFAFAQKYEGADELLAKILSQKRSLATQDNTRVEIPFPRVNVPFPDINADRPSETSTTKPSGWRAKRRIRRKT